MSAHQVPHDDQTVIDPRREWAVYRCAHGCLHISIDRVMLTLTEDEFRALQDLMHKAWRQIHGGEAPYGASDRAH